MRADARDVLVVITDFNGYQQTRRCLEALRSSRYRDFGVIVVDHGTQEETGEGLLREFPEVRVIRASPQLWWAGANNAGIRHALSLGASAVVLLNNDCYVTPETMEHLLQASRERPGAIVAAVQRDLATGRLTCIAPRSLLLLGFPTWIGPRRLTPAMRSRRLLPAKLVVGGRGAVLPATVLARNGLFDEERLPHYGADHDFYLRARKRGIALYAATEAVVDVDSTRSSAASNPGRLSLREFVATLSSVRSHRNIPHMVELFRLHYPVKHLHLAGVALCAARYCAVYAWARLRLALSPASSTPGRATPR